MYTGKLVRLRAYKKEDLPLAQVWLNDPEMKTNLAPGIPYPYTLEDEEKWYLGNTSSNNDVYTFAIEDLATGSYIGGCGINWVDWKNSRAMVGIAIGNKDFLGKGYGTDAMEVLVAFIFNQMNIRKIKLMVYAFNERAIQSYKKCGFVVEGVKKLEVFKNGAYHDEIEMALFRDDWEARRKQATK
jgi:RimJ/RimL family protein N-acetyltransferase